MSKGSLMMAMTVAAMTNSKAFSSQWHNNNTSNNPIYTPKRSRTIKRKKGRNK